MKSPDYHVCQNCGAPLEPEAIWSEENTPPKLVSNFLEDFYAERVTTANSDVAGKHYVASAKKEIRSSRPGKFAQVLEPKIRLTGLLEGMLEGDVELDTPLCAECCDTLIEILDQKIEYIEDERSYEVLGRYLLGLEAKKDRDEEDSIEELQAELARLEEEERKLIRRCDNLEFERDSTFKERDLLKRELADLEESLEREMRVCFRLEHEKSAAEEELISLKNQYAYYRNRLKTLNETNAFKHMFKMRYDDRIGEINGYNLGSPTASEIVWKEINIAWGETVFLLDLLTKMFKFENKKYVLKPLGDRSRIEVPADKSKKLPLYCFGGFDEQLFRDFDAAQVAFLECLTLLEGGIRTRFKDFKLKHPIWRHKIFERDSEVAYSITYTLNALDDWTKALRCVLVNLEQILTLFIEKVRDKQPRFTYQNE